MAGNNKSLSHEQITALSPGLLPPLVKEIVCGLLYVIIHISLPLGKKKRKPCICLEGYIFHEIFLNLCSMFMLSAAYGIVLRGPSCPLVSLRILLSGHATSTLQAPTCPSRRKRRTTFHSLTPSLPPSLLPSQQLSSCSSQHWSLSTTSRSHWRRKLHE